METQQKGDHRQKKTTKIPLPVHPLPPLLKHLISDVTKRAVRNPLGTLYHEAGPSSNTQVMKPLKNDTKYVTTREKAEAKLDWELKVFQDDDGNSSVISISDDEDNVKKEDPSKGCKISTLDINVRASQTDVRAQKPETPRRVKNIKRSLKRPHSRELLGMSPGGKRRVYEIDISQRYSVRNRLQDVLKSPDLLTRQYTYRVTREYSTDIYEHLLAEERRPPEKLFISGDTRCCVVNWLMKINGPDGDPAVLQSACWYLDGILALEETPMERLQLLASACYWIALKLHQPAMSAGRLVKFAGQAFTTAELVSAEKAVLETLGFPPKPIVPQEFITYLSWACDKENPGEVEVAATFLCASALLYKPSRYCEYPSVVAAAAVKNALQLLRKKELFTVLTDSPVYVSSVNKSVDFGATCTAQRLSVRTVASAKFAYRVPFEIYGVPPHYIAQRITRATSGLAVVDFLHKA